VVGVEDVGVGEAGGVVVHAPGVDDDHLSVLLVDVWYG
jgi:hypothetical protein